MKNYIQHLKTGRAWRVVTLIVVAMFLNYNYLKYADDEFFIYSVFIGIIFLVFFAMFLITIIRDKREYKQTRSKYSFAPSIVGFLFLLLLICSDLMLKARDNSPVLIQANFDGGYNGLSFEFREDGTYKFATYSLGAEYYRGKYSINDSIIMIDDKITDKAIENNIFTVSVNNQGEKVLYQVDNELNILAAVTFTINVDNRRQKN